MSARILVVEDNVENMRLMQMLLGSRSYTVLKAVDGEEGLKVALRERPDLIIMDIELPKINGLDVVRKLRENPAFNSIPIIALTAYAMKSDREKAMEAGCNAYFSKPFSTRELLEAIANMLPKKSVTN